MTPLETLRHALGQFDRALLGYSGGVDSALLAVVGRQALGARRFLAVIGRSASYPEVQHQAAVDLARRFDIPLLEVETQELADPRYRANPTDRCYFCKDELWRRLRAVAAERGFDSILDGTNADDLTEHRPGKRAAAEQGIRSPLAELGWTKEAVRVASRELELPDWDAPASPCLSSRVLYGLEITPARLRQVGEGENFLRSMGVTGDLRVRHHGDRARIEVSAREIEGVRRQWAAVETFFGALGFSSVELDPDGYRRGGLLALVSPGS
jgi:uncharacterized protein